jgi:hypothetical protein
MQLFGMCSKVFLDVIQMESIHELHPHSGGSLAKIVEITIFVNLGLFWHFETITNIRTWLKSHRYWRML